MNIKDLCEKFKDYVTKDEFTWRINPLEKLTYGLLGLVLISFTTFLLSFIFKK